MFMDPKTRALYGSSKRIQFNDESVPVISVPDLDLLSDRNLIGRPVIPPDRNPSNMAPSLSLNREGDSPEDYDFGDAVLKYISEMLMEEDMQEKTCMLHECTALQAAEKSFYDALGQEYRPSTQSQTPYSEQSSEGPDENHYKNFSTFISSLHSDLSDPTQPHIGNVSIDVAAQSTPQSSFSSSNSSSNIIDGLVDSPVSILRIPDMLCDDQSVIQFRKGVEEASKFLPNGDNLFFLLDNNVSSLQESKEDFKKYESDHSPDGSRGKKNPHPEDSGLEEGRSNKQSAVYSETTVTSEMFDMVLLCNGEQVEATLREDLRNGVNKYVQQNGQSKGSSRGKKQNHKKDLVDLRTLLTLCAQAVVSDDRRTANELLKQVRQHSSPMGDGSQRLAHYFANGLEARLAGSGTQIYRDLVATRISAAEFLKAYHLYLTVCPFRKLANFFANKTILKLAEKSSRIHIIDFGILYGFQWPCLLKGLSSRFGGAPKLRITGIDLPNPGFRPAERVEETGRRLKRYAESFNVPFEFTAIAQKWETIQIEDLKIDSEEVLVVNSLFRLRNLLDESVMVESPRNIVLNLIRKMKPDIIIQGIINGAYSAPFFITRFREALFHFSAFFDMLETTVPRDIPERIMLEKDIFGREAMNVIACEGSERIERPETYKQWQVRNLRAGFRQLPLDKEIVRMAKERVKSFYHKDFVIDEDGHWLLQGWKGRIVYGLSSWKPAN